MKTINKIFKFLFLIGILFSSVIASSIHVYNDTMKVSPDFFGINTLYWLQDDKTRNSRKLNKALKDMHLEMMRYPGGEVADNFNWKTNTLDNPKEFPYSKSSIDFSKRMDFDEFISWKNKLGANAIIVVNLEEGFIEGNIEKAAKKAAEWVRYANIIKNYNIKYWEIGNESYHLKTRYALTAKQYANAYKIFYKYMKSVDPTIKLGAIGPLKSNKIVNIDYLKRSEIDRIHSIRNTRKRNRYIASLEKKIKRRRRKIHISKSKAWWHIIQKELGKKIDFAVLHRYSSPRLHNSQMDIPLQLDEPVVNLRRYLSRKTEKIIPVAVTEWSFPKKSTLSGIFKQLTLAEMISDYLKSGAFITCYFPMYKHKKNYRAIFDYKTLDPKPVYYTYKSFSSNIGNKLLKTESDDEDIYVIASELKTSPGIIIYIINKSHHHKEITLTIPKTMKLDNIELIDKEHLKNHKHTELDHKITKIIKIKIPGLSISLLKLGN